jgi:hypothetical protein
VLDDGFAVREDDGKAFSPTETHPRPVMDRKPPVPVCKAFLVCSRLTGGHGQYELELQLHDTAGNVVWRDGPEEKWLPASPLDVVDVPWTIMPIFPGPGDYSLVLTANDEELAREPFYARHPQQMPTA